MVVRPPDGCATARLVVRPVVRPPDWLYNLAKWLYNQAKPGYMVADVRNVSEICQKCGRRCRMSVIYYI